MEREDKVTKLSAIDNFEGDGIKRIVMESLIKARRLAWLKRILNDNESTWKFCLSAIWNNRDLRIDGNLCFTRRILI